MRAASARAAALAAFLSVLSVAMAVVVASPAAALPVLERADAEELVTLLAEAAEEQDVCYGWRIEVNDEERGLPGWDEGSNLGLNRGPESCARFVQLVGRVRYTAESSESEDSASWRLETNIPAGPRTPDLERAGYSADALVGPRDDVALFNATLALPLLTAEAGVAPAITAEPDAQPVAPGDMPTGRSGSDWLRQNGEVLALGGFVAAAGLCWAGYGVVKPYLEGQHTNGRQDEQDGEESTEDT